MADYYSILNKTISGLAKNTPEVREAVYGKARSAIEAQLRRLDPPPSEETISSQLGLLEEAILVIEAENNPSSIEDELEEIIGLEEPPTIDEIEAAPVEETPEPVTPEPVKSELTAQEAGTVEPPVVTELPADAPVSSTVEPTPDPFAGLPEKPIASPANGSIDATEQPPKKSRKLVKVLIYLLIIAALSGAVYGVWANRMALEPMVASLLGGSDNEDVAETASPEDEQEAVEENNNELEKEPVRLGADGEDEQAEDPAGTETDLQPASEVPVVLDQPEETTVEDTQEPEVEAVEEGTEAESTEVQANQADAAKLGEVAYLYEEGSAGSGATRSGATVSWSVARVKPTDDLPPESVIVGNMDIPEKNLAVEINIKRNIDPALSASHIIEISFEVPEGFVGGNIDSIARFVLKPTEEARGEPLVAVPVKVDDGYFLIALDNLDQAIEVNQQLLVSSGWIDIPISYTTGKRALLTLEKGGTGEQAFSEAFADWKNR